MSMGNSWSYVSTDTYKSTNQLVHLLCDIVAKGGNFLLNVGPDADGNLPDTALLRMKEIGQWMQVNGEAIYATRPIYPFTYGEFRFTQKGDKIYAIFLLDEQEPEVKYDSIVTGKTTLLGYSIPDSYWFEMPMNLKIGKIKVLGSTTKASLCREADGRYRIDFPNNLTEVPHAVVFEMKRK